MTVEIHLTRGYVALVDDEDFRLVRYLWSAQVIPYKNGGQVVYATRNTSRKDPGGKGTVLLHRVIMDVSDPKIIVDHQDGDGLNCQRYNLRVGTQQINMRNKHPDHQPGIWRHPNGKWHSSITVSKRHIFLGSFDTEPEAIAARVAGEIEHWGEVPFRRRK